METNSNQMTYAKALDHVLTNCEIPQDVRTKLETLKAQTLKKSSSGKETETQRENKEKCKEIYTYVSTRGGEFTPADIRQKFNLTSQKITPLIKALVADGKIQYVKSSKGVKFYKAI